MILLLEQQVIPALVGILFTFISWLFVKIFFSPRIAISKNISKKTVDDRTAYRVKIKNYGFRKCSDLIVYAKLEVRGLNEKSKGNFDSFFVNRSFDGIYPVLYKGRSILLHIYNTIQYDRNYYSPNFISKIENASSVEDLLNLTDNTKLIIYVIATDNFSGSRKLFTSVEYTVENIDERSFCKDSVELYKK